MGVTKLLGALASAGVFGRWSRPSRGAATAVGGVRHHQKKQEDRVPAQFPALHSMGSAIPSRARYEGALEPPTSPKENWPKERNSTAKLEIVESSFASFHRRTWQGGQKCG